MRKSDGGTGGVEIATRPCRSGRVRKLILRAVGVLAAVYLILLLPERAPPTPVGARESTFVWNCDAFWSELERQFVQARMAPPEDLTNSIRSRLTAAREMLSSLQPPLTPDDAGLDRLEIALFELAPLIAARPGFASDYVDLVARARVLVKRRADDWDLSKVPARARLYRTLFGTRLAMEEVMLQSGVEDFPEIMVLTRDASATPHTELRGVKLHSGDILVSRGGAATSALIARGNDFPGSFSHVALLHVEERSGEASIIESHIECGVTVSSLDTYLSDRKLRLMVLRLRDGFPALQVDPMLPHKAAAEALKEARERHIPYDFAMDYRDAEEQFCSEVVAHAYARQGVQLWRSPTSISGAVVVHWLASVGVRHFETQEPSDLEADPQLEIVAEWRDRVELLKAHVDDAVTDVMLESSAPGPLPYNRWKLPFARVMKAWSALLNTSGKVGPIPEGMSATQALRVAGYRETHAVRADRVLQEARRFRLEKGYEPPYWELVKMAQGAAEK